MSHTAPIDAQLNPWPGLAFYTEQDQLSFFGREQESADLFRLLQRDTLTVLFGRSGLGKTSLLRAGLVPRLHEHALFPILLRLNYAHEALSPADQVKVLTLEAANNADIDVENLSACTPEMTLWEFFHTVEFWGVRNDVLTPVLIFDQFEELFTLGRAGEISRKFIDQLADLVENRVPQQVIDRINASGDRHTLAGNAPTYKIIITLREDFVPKLDSLLPIMPAVMRNRLALQPLTTEQAMEVILGAGKPWVMEPVARAIVSAVAGKGAAAMEYDPGPVEIEPAYLSVMCHELFRRMQELSLSEITLELVTSEQGNILVDLYERSFDGLSNQARHFVEDRLLTPSGFRATLPLEDAKREGIAPEELNILVDRRLLRFEDRLGARHVELSHDLLTGIAQASREQRQREEALELERKQKAEMRAKLRRSRLQTAMALGIAVVLLGIGGFIYNAFFHKHVTYYKSFTKRFGVPVGIGKLTQEEVRHRFYSIKITEKGFPKKVLRLEVVSPEGNLSSFHDISLNQFKAAFQVNSIVSSEVDLETAKPTPCRWKFIYGSGNRIVYQIVEDRLGQMVYGVVYTPQSESLAKDTHFDKAMYVGPDGYPQAQASSRAEYITITYSATGEENEIHFTDRQGNAMPGPNRVFGYRYSYDTKGRPVRAVSLGIDGQPAADMNGIVATTCQYDEQDNLVRISFLNGEGAKTLHKKFGFAESTMQYDRWGNANVISYIDSYGEPGRDVKANIHKFMINYNDEQLEMLELSCFDDQDQMTKCLDLDGLSARPINAHLNKNMDLVKLIIPVNNESMTSIELRFDYDDRGLIQVQSFFDDKHQAIVNDDNVHRIVIKRNSRYLPEEVRLYDVSGLSPALHKDGFHLSRQMFDNQGRIVEQSRFGLRDEPVEDTSVGAHKIINQYDDRGNVISEEYYDPMGGRVTAKNGYYQKRITYDKYGNKEHECHYGKDQEPVDAGPNTIHCTTWHYDKHGNAITEEYSGGRNEPTVNSKGIHRIEMAYNEKNQEVRKQYFGLDKNPAADDSGVHLYQKVFNPQGLLIDETRLGTRGEAMYDRELGIATYRTKFDDEGRLIEASYYDASNHLAIGPYGNAKTVTVFSENGSKVTNIGTNDKPLFNPIYGHVSLRVDSRKRGKIVERSYHGLDDELLLGPEGYAAQESTYDDEGRPVAARFFGTNQEPVTGKQGVHRVEVQYTQSGERVIMFDIHGKEITAEELAKFPETISISLEVTDKIPQGIKSPAAKAGMQTGDILWRYGDWSFPESIASIREKGAIKENLLKMTWEEMLAERDKRSDEEVPVLVIRHGEPVHLTMPPLPEKQFGALLQGYTVPPDVFASWCAAAEQAKNNQAKQP